MAGSSSQPTRLMPMPRACRYIMLAWAPLLLAGPPAAAQSRTDLAHMSLDSLLAIPVHAAARYAQSMADAPAAVTVVTAEEIAAFGYTTLGQVLGRAAGFHVSDDRNYTYIGVRGFSRPTDYNNRVLLLLNGHVVNEGVYGAAPIGTELGLDLALLERVEIVRGPVSALYGTSAMFAVVNMVTTQPAGTGGGVTTDVGQAGHLSVSGRAHTSSSPDRAFFVAAQYGREDGRDLYYPEYATGGSDGVARDLDWTTYASGFAAARLGDLRVHARASTREKGIPTGSWSTSFGDPDARTIDSWAQLAGTYDRPLHPSLLLSISAAGDLYWYRGRYPDEYGPYDDSTDAHRLNASAQTVWDVSPRNRVVTGVAVTHSPRADYFGGYPDGFDFEVNEPYSTAALYLQDELHVRPWLSVIAGGRIDAQSETRARVTPRGSVILRPVDGTTVKLLYGAAFRSPNIYERAFGNASSGRSSGLRSERILTREIVAEQRLSRAASMRVSLFSDHMRDLIDAVENPISGEIGYANVGRAETRGLEGEFTASAGGWLIRGSGSLLSAMDRDTDERLTNAPRGILRLGANGGVYGNLHGAAQVRTESARLTLAGNETTAFSVADLSLAYRRGTHLKASVSLTNLFNRSYAYPGGVEHLQDAIAQDGRRLRMRVEISR
jgi:outer membrane receptor protein involved in Fe transport